MHALGQLIHDRRQIDSTLTYDRIAELAEVATPTVRNWANTKAQRLDHFPESKSIRGLAAALGVTELQVLLAAADAAGIDINTGGRTNFASRLPPDVENLSSDVQEQLLRLLWALVQDAQKSS